MLYNQKTKNKMNTVTIYNQGQKVNTFNFATEKEAVDCMLRHASEKGLEVNDLYTEAYSEGIKPEILILVNEA